MVTDRFCRSLGIALALALMRVTSSVSAQDGAAGGDWRSIGGGNGFTHYSPLDRINRENVTDLRVAWSWESADAAIWEENRRLRSTNFEGTPLAIDGVLYISTSLSQAVAIDGATGEQLWLFNPESYESGRPPNLGWVNRGLAYWRDGDDERLFLATGDSHIIALNPKTGEPIESFGESGSVDAIIGVPRAIRGRGYGNTSAPLVCRDVVLIGASISDGSSRKEAVPGQVRAYDVRTGEPRWAFQSIPREDEPGVETWEDGSWKYSGNANVWTNMSADEELGYVYLPTSTPTNDFYGGHRRGDNLYAESVVCIEAETGRRVWHFQIVHHGLWDYDLPTAPILCDITVDGKPIKALAQLTKQGYTYVFDRVTGEPVWPINEVDVPQSSIPGEQTSPTQPIPTKPPPYERIGLTVDDLIDFTPELRAEATEILKQFEYGPLFTPPSFKGTIMVPGYGGGANWMGGAFDPETGMLYVPSMTSPLAVRVAKGDPNRTNMDYTRQRAPVPEGPHGLPLLKPPYGRITAFDLNKGEKVWRATNGGDGPRDHPLLKHLNLPSLGTICRAGALVTKTLLFVPEGSGRSGSAREGGPGFRAYDKLTGEILWETEFSMPITNVPMTYAAGGKQFIVVGVGSDPPELVALSLP